MVVCYGEERFWGAWLAWTRAMIVDAGAARGGEDAVRDEEDGSSPCGWPAQLGTAAGISRNHELSGCLGFLAPRLNGRASMERAPQAGQRRRSSPVSVCRSTRHECGISGLEPGCWLA